MTQGLILVLSTFAGTACRSLANIFGIYILKDKNLYLVIFQTSGLLQGEALSAFEKRGHMLLQTLEKKCI